MNTTLKDLIGDVSVTVKFEEASLQRLTLWLSVVLVVFFVLFVFAMKIVKA